MWPMKVSEQWRPEHRKSFGLSLGWPFSADVLTPSVTRDIRLNHEFLKVIASSFSHLTSDGNFLSFRPQILNLIYLYMNSN